MTDARVRAYRFPRIDRVVHGIGAVAKVPRIVEELGARRVMILTGATLDAQTPLIRDLEAALGDRHIGTFSGLRQHAPRECIDGAVAAVHAANADLLIGYGGSSVTDATKIVAVQVLGTGRPQSDLPQVLIPTTLSAGEWTPAAGMTGDVPGVKTYVIDERMAPHSVVLDPEVTRFTPMELWLSTGVKAIDHACEALWGPRPHPMTDALAADALRRILPALTTTFADPENLDARLDAQLAAWMSMAGVMNVQVYLSHTLGHQIGARWGVAHGVTSGITLPAVMRFLHDGSPVAMVTVAAALGIRTRGLTTRDACDAGAAELQGVVAQLGLPSRLRDVGADPRDFAAVAQATVTAAQQTGWGGALEGAAIERLLEEMW